MSSDRQKTPDILGEILSDISVSSPRKDNASREMDLGVQIKKTKKSGLPANLKKGTSRPKKSADHKVVNPAGVEVAKKNLRTEYRLVSFQNFHGWRPRFINGVELEKWTENPVIHVFINKIAEEGWELVTSTSGEHMYGAADTHQLIFKRILSEEK